MFGMGFTEIFLILVVAIIALGPEKLPNAAIEIARFIKKIKGGVEDAKATLDNELNISKMQEDIHHFKSHLDVDRLASLEYDEPKLPKNEKTQEKTNDQLNKQEKKG